MEHFMETTQNNDQEKNTSTEGSLFTFKKISAGIILMLLLAAVGVFAFDFFSDSEDTYSSNQRYISRRTISHRTTYKKELQPPQKTLSKDALAHEVEVLNKEVSTTIQPSEKTSVKEAEKDDEQTAQKEETKEEDKVPGIAFVEATIGPLHYELYDRFWGWRPNDFLAFLTDNVNNFQLGVIKVTQRTAEKLADNISRTGSTAAFDKNLEHARSTCFVIEAESWMFPSAESRYKTGLDELKKYAEKLTREEATFYTRADNLIPLLEEYEHLLGDCDDNLVKSREENGSKVSFFKADNYFYYAKGVVNAMLPVLEAIEKDFQQTLERRNCLEVVQRAIESCEHATHINPWLVTNADLSGILANHRANMAAHISHARFYVEVLIKTLST